MENTDKTGFSTILLYNKSFENLKEKKTQL